VGGKKEQGLQRLLGIGVLGGAVVAFGEFEDFQELWEIG
jgi:hypothetical protein